MRLGRLAAAQCVFISAAFPAAPTIGGCKIFPDNNIWNTPIDKMPVDPRSPRYVTSIGADKPLHPDFSDTGGIPFAIIPPNQPMVPVALEFTETDPGPYPIPPDPPIEAGTDRHILLLQTGKCILYELYAVNRKPDGAWTAACGAIYDLKSNRLRPDGWTSADAAGLPILPGLVKYEEVASGEIRHAIRFTAPQTRRQYVWPARHFASRHDVEHMPPMGQRFRLKADFDISRFSRETQVILTALKKYGMMLADNGGAWYITGAPDKRWRANEITEEMRRIRGSDFEAVDVSELMVTPNSAQVLTDSAGAAPRAAEGGAKPAFLNLGQRYLNLAQLSEIQLNHQTKTAALYAAGRVAIALSPEESQAAYKFFTGPGFTEWAHLVAIGK